MPRIYTTSKTFTNPATTKTLIQIANSTSKLLQILRLEVTQPSLTASGQAEFWMGRISTPGTTGTAMVAADWVPHDPGDPAIALQLGAALTAINLGVEPTYLAAGPSKVWGFNVLNGLLYLPVPEERWWLAAGGLFGVKFNSTPTAAVYRVEITVEEVG